MCGFSKRFVKGACFLNFSATFRRSSTSLCPCCFCTHATQPLTLAGANNGLLFYEKLPKRALHAQAALGQSWATEISAARCRRLSRARPAKGYYFAKTSKIEDQQSCWRRYFSLRAFGRLTSWCKAWKRHSGRRWKSGQCSLHIFSSFATSCYAWRAECEATPAACCAYFSHLTTFFVFFFCCVLSRHTAEVL